MSLEILRRYKREKEKNINYLGRDFVEETRERKGERHKIFGQG